MFMQHKTPYERLDTANHDRTEHRPPRVPRDWRRF
jgi:hypothetical protein